MPTSRRFRDFSYLVLAATLGVILWGAYVRASGSGAGCGSHWPTCHGEVIPRDKGVKTLIELTHRATSGLAFLLVLAQLVWALLAFPSGHRVRRGATFSMFFMVTEAAVGAGLVLLELVAENKSIARALWMALHLTNTFLLVGSLTLTCWWARGGDRLRLRGQGVVAVAGLFALFGTLVLGISGAITALGDTLFPVTSVLEGMRQDFSPTAHFLLRLRLLHPVIGLALGGYLFFAGGLFTSRKPRREVRVLAAVSGGLFLFQVCLGFLNVALSAPTAMQILHLLTADLVWMSVVLLCASTLSDAALTSPSASSPAPRPEALHTQPPPIASRSD